MCPASVANAGFVAFERRICVAEYELQHVAQTVLDMLCRTWTCGVCDDDTEYVQAVELVNDGDQECLRGRQGMRGVCFVRGRIFIPAMVWQG